MDREILRSVLKNEHNGDQWIPLICQCDKKHCVEHKLSDSKAPLSKWLYTLDAVRRSCHLNFLCIDFIS